MFHVSFLFSSSEKLKKFSKCQNLGLLETNLSEESNYLGSIRITFFSNNLIFLSIKF